jgi:alpha-pyrone synthase
MKSSIVAIGTAVPACKIEQQHAAELVSTRLNLSAAEKRLLKSVYNATGIDSRHTVLRNEAYLSFYPDDPNQPFPTTEDRMVIYKDNALPLAINAITNCLESLPTLKLTDVTHLITVSCTGMYAPGIDIELVQQLELNSSTKRTCINFMGCYGAFNALKVADDICKSDPTANVLVVSVEICSIHFQNNTNLDNLISNAIFSDGAAAVLIQAKANQIKQLSIEGFHCDLLPQTSQDMAWKIGNSGFDIVLKSYVPEVIQSGIAQFAKKLLSKFDSSLSQIDLYAIHPGGTKILQACESSLNITKEQNKYSYDVLREYGNMSSATVLFVLKKIWDTLKPNDNQKNLFSCAFGPGLTLESVLIKTHC